MSANIIVPSYDPANTSPFDSEFPSADTSCKITPRADPLPKETTNSDQIHLETSTTSRPKGMLSLITGGILLPSNSPDEAESTITLSYGGNMKPPSTQNTMNAAEYINSKPILLIYFGASWCRPCVNFSPALSKFARKEESRVNVLFVSHDESAEKAEGFVNGKHFGVFPFAHKNSRILNTALGITQLPSVIVLNTSTGKPISTWGRSCVMYNPDECVDAWLRGEEGVSWIQSLCVIS